MFICVRGASIKRTPRIVHFSQADLQANFELLREQTPAVHASIRDDAGNTRNRIQTGRNLPVAGKYKHVDALLSSAQNCW